MVSKRKSASVKRKEPDFKKVKLKVGKVLKKTNATDTTIQSRRVVMLTQLEQPSGSASSSSVTGASAHSFRGLSLENLCTQLGHYSKGIRRNAIVGAKQILSSDPELIESHLRLIVPSFARLIAITDTDSATYAQLRSLLRLVLSVPPSALAPHFSLFTAHTLRAVTHANEDVRSFALSVMEMLLLRYGELCRGSGDIFPTLVHFFSANKKTNLTTLALLHFVSIFLEVFGDAGDKESPTIEVFLSFAGSGSLSRTIDLRDSNRQGDPFFFPVFSASSAASSGSATMATPLQSPQALISLVEALAPLLTRLTMDECKNGQADVLAKCLSRLGALVEQHTNKFLIEDFSVKISKALQALKRAIAVKNDRKVTQAAQWIK